MIREMIPILLLFLQIILSSAQNADNASQQQQTQLPDGKICLFTCSEWIFKEKFQQVASSADLLGPGYLTKHKIGFPSGDPNCQNKDNAPMEYQKVWGAVYSLKQEEYDAVVKQSQIDYSVPFTSNEDVFVVKYNEMNCLVVDLGIQPGDHPPYRHFNTKIPNTIEDEAFYNRLAQIGVPQEYIKGLRNASTKPQYHPIIPQDYHPRDNSQPPKRSFDQLPTVRVHPNPHQIDTTPITGQIPETHDQDIPGLSLPGTPTKPVQPSTHHFLPGVPNPNTVQPSTQHFLPGVPNPNSPPQTLVDQPDYVRPLANVQPSPHDVQVTVPKGIDSGVGVTPDHQPVVVITPMKIPGSTTVQPIVAHPVDNVQGQSPVVIPGKSDDSSAIIPSKGPLLTTHQPKDLDNMPTQVTGVAHPPTSTTPDDQSFVVITPLKLSPNKGDNSAPLVGQDYKVQTPLSVQPDDDVTKPKDVPPILLSGPKQETKVGPVVTRQAPSQGSLLTPDVLAPPRLQTQSPDLLLNPVLQPGKGPESLPTSYDVPCDNSLPGSNSGLLTLSPTSNVPLTHQNDSPLLTLNNTPDIANQPVQQVPHQLTPSTANVDKPDLLLTNTAPNHLQTHPDVQHTVHLIPASFGVDKPVPIIPKQPMFGFEQCHQPVDVSHVPVTSLDNNPTVITHPITPKTVDVGTNPDILQTNTAPNHLPIQPTGDHTLHQIPASFGVTKPVPNVTDKPMFTLDQPDCPSKSNPNYYQVNPNTLEHVNNPDQLLTNTGPGPGRSIPIPDHIDDYGSPQVQPCSVTPTPDHIDDYVRPNTGPGPGRPVSLTPTDHIDDYLLPNTGPGVQTSPTPADHIDDYLLPNTGPGVQTSPTPADHIDDYLLPNTGPGSHPQDVPCTGKPTTTSYQVTPNTLNHADNPALLLPNTGPGPSSQLPTGGQTVHQIPSNFGVSKPAAVLPDKPMFSYQSNAPTSAIPATFGITSQPPAVKDEPMFSLNNSPSLLQPKHIDDDNYKIPTSTVTPINTVDQPHATGLLPNKPGLLVSQPDSVPLTSNNIPGSTTVHQLPNQVDLHPAQVSSTPSNLGTTNIPESAMFQAPNPVVTGNPAVLATKPDNVPLATVTPDTHTVQIPNQVVNNNKPAQVVSKPLLGTTNIPESAMIQEPNPVVNTATPTLLPSKPDSVPLTASPIVHHDVTPQSVNTVGPAVTPEVTPQPVQQVPPPTYTPSTFMAPNYTPVSPVLGYSFAHRYPQYLHNSTYKPPNCFYNPEELIPGFTFGSHIQLY